MIFLTKCSVVIPAKNRADFLERAVRSVYKQDIVSNERIEIIIVNDASTDKTNIIVNKLKNEINIPIKYIINKNSLGGAVARNQGANLAIGEYIAFLDSDDEWLPSHLSSGIEILEAKQNLGIFSSFYIKKNDEEKKAKCVSEKPSKMTMSDYIFSNLGDTRTSTFIFNLKAFREVMFDEKQQKHQDWDLAIRFDKKYKMVVNKNQTAILHYDPVNRMSGKLNHSATLYLINKHRTSIQKKNLAIFYLYLMTATIKLEGKNKFYFYYQKKLDNLIKKNNIQLNKKQNLKRMIFRYLPYKCIRMFLF